jgi:hypothetical protein
VAASSDAVRDTGPPKPLASEGRVALTSFAILALIYQRHIPEPLFGMIWVKNALDYAEMALGTVLLGQQLRVSYRFACTGFQRVREFGRATVTLFRNASIVKITVEVPESLPADASATAASETDVQTS